MASVAVRIGKAKMIRIHSAQAAPNEDRHLHERHPRAAHLEDGHQEVNPGNGTPTPAICTAQIQ